MVRFDGSMVAVDILFYFFLKTGFGLLRMTSNAKNRFSIIFPRSSTVGN